MMKKYYLFLFVLGSGYPFSMMAQDSIKSGWVQVDPTPKPYVKPNPKKPEVAAEYPKPAMSPKIESKPQDIAPTMQKPSSLKTMLDNGKNDDASEHAVVDYILTGDAEAQNRMCALLEKNPKFVTRFEQNTSKAITGMPPTSSNNVLITVVISLLCGSLSTCGMWFALSKPKL